MTITVFLIMLASAACHAGWNATVKLKLPPFDAIALMGIATSLMVLPLLPIFGLPARESWFYLAISMTLHVTYFVTLAEAYRVGDLAQVYPVARGAAPLLTSLFAPLFVGEVLSPLAWLGVVALTSGVALLSLRGGRTAGQIEGRAVVFALLTSCSIAAYSITDGIGSRLSGSPHAYTILLFLFDGVLMIVLGLLKRGPAIFQGFRGNLRPILFGGALSLISYWIAVWAMTQAPIALVGAVRETSVLFAALIGYFMLKEPFGTVRAASVVMVTAGLVLIRLS